LMIAWITYFKIITKRIVVCFNNFIFHVYILVTENY
jgi:hypothetical protein